MKVKRMGITEILRRIWLFSANKTQSSGLFSKQLTQLIVQLNSSLRQIIDLPLKQSTGTILKNSYFLIFSVTDLIAELNEVFLKLVYAWDQDPRASRILRQIMEYVSHGHLSL